MTADVIVLSSRERPYPGTQPFDSEAGQRFFGRTTEVAAVVELWKTHRLTILSGASGSGMTSLLRAGVLPSLRRDRADVLPIGRVVPDDVIPFMAPVGSNPPLTTLLLSWSDMPEGGRGRSAGKDTSPGDTSSGRAGVGSIAEFLRLRGVRRDPDGGPLPVLAAVDQVEALFTAPSLPRHQVDGFIDELAEAMRDRPELHLLLVVREAYRAELVPYTERLVPEAPPHARLEFLSLDAALEAVHGPIETTDRRFAPEAAESLVDDLGSRPGLAEGDQPRREDGDIGVVAPTLLQVCCTRIWKRVPADVRLITSAHIQTYADVDGALTDFASRVLTEVAADHSVELGELRSWVQRTFVTDQGTGRLVPASVAHTAVDDDVLRALEDRHLLRTKRGPNGMHYLLHHDRLIEAIRRVPGAFTAVDYLRSAELALAGGELTLADKHVAEAVAASADTDLRLRAQAESLWGDIAAERGQSDDAECRYRSAANLYEVLQDSQAVGLLLAMIGRLQFAQGRRADAFEELCAAADRLPADPSVHIALSRVLWSMGRREAAVSVLSGLLSGDEDAPDLLRTRGEFLADLGEARRALRDLDRVRRNARPVSRAARALALATLNDLDDASQEIGVALRDAPQSGPVLLYAAKVEDVMGDPAIAADLARRAIEATTPPLPQHQLDEARRFLRQSTGQ